MRLTKKGIEIINYEFENYDTISVEDVITYTEQRYKKLSSEAKKRHSLKEYTIAMLKSIRDSEEMNTRLEEEYDKKLELIENQEDTNERRLEFQTTPEVSVDMNPVEVNDEAQKPRNKVKDYVGLAFTNTAFNIKIQNTDISVANGLVTMKHQGIMKGIEVNIAPKEKTGQITFNTLTRSFTLSTSPRK